MFLSPCLPECASQQNSNKRSIYKKCSPQKAAFFNSITHRKLLISFQFQTISCYRTIRLQNFKDIHNTLPYLPSLQVLLQNYQITKFQRHTQRSGHPIQHRATVIELLDYKISKTYTTGDTAIGHENTLLQNYQITKFQRHTQPRVMAQGEPPRCYRTIRLQNFKDIHNAASHYGISMWVVIELLDYKISKTYTTDKACERIDYGLLQNYQITKFQRHTQLHLPARHRQGTVIELLDYKISKTKRVYFKKMLQRYYFFLKYANEY